jgi:hypothetical protein
MYDDFRGCSLYFMIVAYFSRVEYNSFQ